MSTMTPTTISISTMMPPPLVPTTSSTSSSSSNQSPSASPLLESDCATALALSTSIPSPSLPPAPSQQSPTAPPLGSSVPPFSLSPAQLLAIVPHPPPFSVSAYLGSDVPVHRRAHSSSKKNHQYDAIQPTSLVSISDYLLLGFRKFVDSMSGKVSFDSELKLPFRASSLTNEADVAIYLETQVIIAAWETVIEMVPTTERNYDLMTLRQMHMGGGVPDQTFGFFAVDDTADKILFTSFLLIELKAPGMVRGLLSVFDNVRAKRDVNPPYNWVAITKQLRKYAVTTATRDILVMDDSTAVYFRFPEDPLSQHEDIGYLVVGPSNEGCYSDLTMREMVAFVGWRSLALKGIRFRSFGEDGTSAADTDEAPAGADTYCSVLDLDPESKPAKRTATDEGERTQPKRNKSNGGQQPGDEQIIFDGWVTGASVTLQRDEPVEQTKPTHKREPSHDSAYFETNEPASARKPRPLDPPLLWASPHTKATTQTFIVSRVITRNVALLTDPQRGSPVLAKLFPPHPDSTRLLANELGAYHACRSLQGGEIPHLYGVCRVVDPCGCDAPVILSEYITPGTTVESIRDPTRLQRLRGSAEKALDAVHQCAVIHNDACGRNLVVGDDDQVVLVDFDVASVFTADRGGARRKAWEDWVCLGEAFRGVDGV